MNPMSRYACARLVIPYNPDTLLKLQQTGSGPPTLALEK